MSSWRTSATTTTMCELKYCWLHLTRQGIYSRYTTYQSATDESTDEFDDKLYLTLEPKLRPLEPDPSCEESVETFKEHKEIAKEYLKVQTELAYLAQKLQDLQEEASRCESLQPKIDDQQEVKKLREEKDSLLQYYNSLKNKLDEVTRNNAQKNDWVFVPSNSEHPT